MSGRTTERILNAAAKGLLFMLLYVMLGLCWIGAECVFEGIVHDSRVDGVVLAWLWPDRGRNRAVRAENQR